ncbi:MAG: hypothetical protein QOI71_480, partial [Gaiellales bacterium]|nr:hypothetical protein [Gaiellales bacterium]
LAAVAQTQRQNALALQELRAQVAWLEGGGWYSREDGLWRHARKAADIGLTHSQAFPTTHTVRTRNGAARSSMLKLRTSHR